ncbi:MAG: NAD(P)H-hydrate dehydratase [Oscillospiraceae bacterium]
MKIQDFTEFVLPSRPENAHKGNFGRVYILGGSVGYTGAPLLASNSCVRSGAGLCFLGVPAEIYPIVAARCLEAMPFPLPQSVGAVVERLAAADVVVLGPGLGRSPWAEELTLAVLQGVSCPVVLDADGLNAVAAHITILERRKAPTVLTPHEGEFLRLGGSPAGDRTAAAAKFAQDCGCTVVLKGQSTVTCYPDGTCYRNTTGNPGMATGGSGDVLAGLMGGLLGQGFPPEAAVWLHGRAGDLARDEKGEYAMTAGDIAEMLPVAMKNCEEERLCAKKGCAH